MNAVSERAVGEYALYCGQINYADEPLEENPGGYACACTNNLTPIKLTLQPAGLPGRVTLSANVDETRIRVWQNANRTGAVPLPKTWPAGAAIPATLYVEGVTNSASARDIALTLTYDENPPNKSNPLFKCEDVVCLTVLKVELEINNTADETDDVVCRYSTNPAGRPTIPCRARIQGLGSGSKTIVLTSTKVRFPSATDTTKTLLLPASGAWVNFTTSGQTESAAKDDALIEAHLDTATGAVCGSEDLAELLERTDLSQKVRDVEHLLFSRQSSQGILLFPEFVATLS